jgi:hypothetical protein
LTRKIKIGHQLATVTQDSKLFKTNIFIFRAMKLVALR